MTMPSPMSAVAVATSIPPNLSRNNAGHRLDHEYQKVCIASWFQCGFRVLSVNAASEIPQLKARYPDVVFVTAGRSASLEPSKPLIADLLGALAAASEPVLGIINSDIVFEPSSAWQERLPDLVEYAVVTGQRNDASSLLEGTFRKYYWGFDHFFFDHAAAHDLKANARNFAMGLAWWDYWLPACASFNGRSVVAVERPCVAHLIHKEPYLDAGWREMGLEFARFVDLRARERHGIVPPAINPLLANCHVLATMTNGMTGDGQIDMRISQLAVDYVPQLTRNVVNLDRNRAVSKSATITENGRLTPDNIFRKFEERLQAGEQLERAKRLERENRIVEAEVDFRAARAQTPRDFDLLCAFGEHLLRRRDYQHAADLLQKAAEQNPDSCRLMNSLAAALRALNRYAEAIACLERAREAEPDDQATYCNIALTLNESGRRTDAIQILETALIKWPDFKAAAELKDQLCGRPHIVP
jgi:hypothetical protein